MLDPKCHSQDRSERAGLPVFPGAWETALLTCATDQSAWLSSRA